MKLKGALEIYKIGIKWGVVLRQLLAGKRETGLLNTIGFYYYDGYKVLKNITDPRAQIGHFDIV